MDLDGVSLMVSGCATPAACSQLERMTGIEPALSAWEADVLPLNYIRVLASAGAQAGAAPTSYRNWPPGWVLLPDRGSGWAAWPGVSGQAKRSAGYRNESKPPFLAVPRNAVHEVTG